ncbi:unnamed protein product [Phaedon cochleariae]|uniref:Uncharacterized protein n=1 Tax=Phaedon cochleariae TaxID=80249 RepID=A0A9P0DZR6_PHACE|nr:unnamed protein product [Phaedon cochleariae]
MVVKLQEVEPSATKKTVVKKLDSMRGCFRKEAKKVKASKTTGTGADDVYVPHLWYYEHLLFLSDQEIARDSISNMTESTEKMQMSTSRQSQVDSDIDADSSHDSTPADTAIEEVGDHTRPLPRTSFARRGAVPVTIPNTKKVKKTKHDDIMKQLEVELNKPEDDDDIIGRNIANKLRRLPAEIKIVTEKLIMDVLYEAFLGNINKFTRITFNNHNAAVLENRSSGSSSLGTYGTHFPPVVPQDSSDWPLGDAVISKKPRALTTLKEDSPLSISEHCTECKFLFAKRGNKRNDKLTKNYKETLEMTQEYEEGNSELGSLIMSNTDNDIQAKPGNQRTGNNEFKKASASNIGTEAARVSSGSLKQFSEAKETIINFLSSSKGSTNRKKVATESLEQMTNAFTELMTYITQKATEKRVTEKLADLHDKLDISSGRIDTIKKPTYAEKVVGSANFKSGKIPSGNG